MFSFLTYGQIDHVVECVDEGFRKTNLSCSILQGVQSLVQKEKRKAGSQLGGWDDNVPGDVGDLHHDWPNHMLEQRITNVVEEKF